MNRILRTLLAVVLATGALAAPAFADGTLPSGVAVGEVTSSSAVLWSRSTAAPGIVLFRVSRDPQFHGPVLFRLGLALGAHRPAKAFGAPLQAGKTYCYEARDMAGSVETGTFRTAPSPGLPGVAQARTLDEFRAKNSEVYSPFLGVNGLGDLRRSTAILAMLDDHEVTNDFAGGAGPASDPRFDLSGDFINETQLFRNGPQAFVEYNPLLPTYYGPTGDPRTSFERKPYRAQRYGKLAALGYSLLGLEGPAISATLLEGSYVATHVCGWSEIEVSPLTGVLTITTYGVSPATPLAAPAVVGRFSVQLQ